MLGGSAGRATGRDGPLNGVNAGLGALGGATLGAAAGLAAAFGAAFGVAFAAVLFLAAGRLAAAFLAAGRLAVDFLALARLAVDFLAAERLAVDFLAVDRFGVDFLAFAFFFAGISPPSGCAMMARALVQADEDRCCYLRFIASAPPKDKHSLALAGHQCAFSQFSTVPNRRSCSRSTVIAWPDRSNQINCLSVDPSRSRMCGALPTSTVRSPRPCMINAGTRTCGSSRSRTRSRCIRLSIQTVGRRA